MLSIAGDRFQKVQIAPAISANCHGSYGSANRAAVIVSVYVNSPEPTTSNGMVIRQPRRQAITSAIGVSASRIVRGVQYMMYCLTPCALGLSASTHSVFHKRMPHSST